MNGGILTTKSLVSTILAVYAAVAHLSLADTDVLAAIELAGRLALAAVLLVALVLAIGKAIAAPLFRYAGAPSQALELLVATF